MSALEQVHVHPASGDTCTAVEPCFYRPDPSFEETTWIDLVCEVQDDETTLRDLPAVGQVEVTLVDEPPAPPSQEAGADPERARQIEETRRCVQNALYAYRHAQGARARAQAQSQLSRMMEARLRRQELAAAALEVSVASAPAAGSPAEGYVRSLRALHDAARQARLTALRFRALAYWAARQASRSMDAAWRRCQALGLSERAFRQAFESSVAQQPDLWRVPTAA